MKKIKISEIAKKIMEQPEVAPDVKPATPKTKPGRRPNPLRPPREAPKPGPKATGEEGKVIDMITQKYLKMAAEGLNEINQADIEKKFVGTGKVVKKDEFQQIMDATKNKLALALWMIKRIEDGFILAEDIYKWEEYFDIFKRLKREFPIKDINQIKTEDDIDDFVNKAEEIKERELDPSKKKGVAKSDKFSGLKIG